MPSRKGIRRHYKRQAKQQQQQQQGKAKEEEEHGRQQDDQQPQKQKNDIEFQVRYEGGALQFFRSFRSAMHFIRSLDADFDTLSFKHQGTRIRIQLKRNLPPEWNWSPESERKIAHLCPTYTAALGQEDTDFWVYQDVLAGFGLYDHKIRTDAVRSALSENGAFLDAKVRKEIEDSVVAADDVHEDRVELREEIMACLQRLDMIKCVWTDHELMVAFGHL